MDWNKYLNISNKRYTPSLSLEYGYKEMLNISNVIEREKLNTELPLDLRYKSIYSNIGLSTDYRYVNPHVKIGINFDVSRLNIDTSLEYNQVFRALFAIRFDVIK
ncbi:hypothetical protein [Streptobacillus moniliformis]|uniref:hypothetical protein n=1 Tax=Streptobacillus moniliformis TaxID=34105 RepID=UPI0007E34B33|nr:hypothetical protein [Streptobacillus moniliformis]